MVNPGLKQDPGIWATNLSVGGSEFGQVTGTVVYTRNGSQLYGTDIFAATLSGTTSVKTPTAIITNGSFIGATRVQGALTLGSSIVVSNNVVNSAGSPYSVGDVIQLTTRSIISGGMWVNTSGANLAFAAAASTETPLGVALATVGSNATASILVRGIYPFVADVALLGGNPVGMGAGAALNTAIALGSPDPTKHRGICMTDAASGATVFVYLY